jgi:hypothetical protein
MVSSTQKEVERVKTFEIKEILKSIPDWPFPIIEPKPRPLTHIERQILSFLKSAKSASNAQIYKNLKIACESTCWYSLQRLINRGLVQRSADHPPKYSLITVEDK